MRKAKYVPGHVLFLNDVVHDSHLMKTQLVRSSFPFTEQMRFPRKLKTRSCWV